MVVLETIRTVKIPEIKRSKIHFPPPIFVLRQFSKVPFVLGFFDQSRAVLMFDFSDNAPFPEVKSFSS